jgi:hypothetical protein
VGVVKVDTTGLQTLAAQADGMASELVGSSPPVAGGNSWQPSIVAVNDVNASVSSAAQTLARRMSTTAEKLAASSSVYTSQDGRAASSIRTVEL